MKRRLLAPAVIFAVVLVVHGLVLCNDGVYWDDWVWLGYTRNGRWDLLAASFSEMGMTPLTTWFFWLPRHLPDPVLAFKVVSFSCTVVSAWLGYGIAVESGRFTRFEAVCLALLALCYPGYELRFLVNNVHYVFYVTLWLGGCFLVLRAERAGGPARVGLRFAAALLFFGGFSLNSLLVVHFAFVALALDVARRRAGLPLRANLRAVLRAVLPGRLDLVLLPVVFWVVKETLFPRHGDYAGYNRFHVAALPAGEVAALVNALWVQLDDSLTELLRQPAAWAAALLALHFAWRRWPGVTAPAPDGPSPRALLAAGAGLFLLTVFPYAAVGLRVGAHGFGTRHAILLGFPVALLLLGTLRLAFGGPDGALSKTGAAVLVTILVAFGSASVANQLDWQARWVKDRSVMEKLKRLPGASRFSVYWIDDDWHLGREVSPYNFYEWTSKLDLIWGGRSHIGYDWRWERDKEIAPPLERYLIEKLDPTGPQALVTVRRGWLPFDEHGIALRYIAYRLAGSRTGLAELLDRATDVKVEPLATKLGTWQGRALGAPTGASAAPP